MDEPDILEKVTEWATVNSVVTGATLKEVAKNVIQNVRFALLDPEKLSQVEKENAKKDYIPVRSNLPTCTVEPPKFNKEATGIN